LITPAQPQTAAPAAQPAQVLPLVKPAVAAPQVPAATVVPRTYEPKIPANLQTPPATPATESTVTPATGTETKQ
jgi:hypothetical protein